METKQKSLGLHILMYFGKKMFIMGHLKFSFWFKYLLNNDSINEVHVYQISKSGTVLLLFSTSSN